MYTWIKGRITVSHVRPKFVIVLECYIQESVDTYRVILGYHCRDIDYNNLREGNLYHR